MTEELILSEELNYVNVRKVLSDVKKWTSMSEV